MKALRVFPAAALAVGSIALAVMPAAASGVGDRHHGHHQSATCTGSAASPGVLSGTYSGNVWINGVCLVNGGAATVDGNLFVTPGSALAAVFANNDVSGSGTSSLTVLKNVVVGKGATFFLGCEPTYFPCLDDPGAQTGPGTLTSNGTIGGNLIAAGALGVIVHASTIGKNALLLGGGYGNSCVTPTDSPSNSPSLEVWAKTANSAPYSDIEDATIGGNAVVAGLTSCWLGINRVTVDRNALVLHNTLNDPDAIEILGSDVHHNLVCLGNSPTLWDSSQAAFGQRGLYPRTSQPNTVGGKRLGQCVLASPASQGGTPGPGAF